MISGAPTSRASSSSAERLRDRRADTGPPFATKCSSQHALAFAMVAKSIPASGVFLACAPGPVAAESRHRCCPTGLSWCRGCRTCRLGLGCLADKAVAEDLFFPEHRTSFGFDSVRIGTLMGHSAQSSLKLLAFLAADWTLVRASIPTGYKLMRQRRIAKRAPPWIN